MSRSRDNASAVTTVPSGVGRNMVINGGMNVSQRSASVAALGAASGYFTLDRWKVQIGDASAGRFTMTQTADGPNGISANCLKLDCTTADTSIAAGERLNLWHRIEGQNLQRIGKGVAGAKEITVSFYVKANAAFTFGCELFDSDNTRQITKLFDTTTGWVRHELTFPADVDDGSSPFDDDNAVSMTLEFWIHSGSTYTSGTLNATAWANSTSANRAAGIDSFFSSTDNNFFLTGVQIEVGPVATEFEQEDISTTLDKCQRYFQDLCTGHGSEGILNLGYYDATRAFGSVQLITEMRTAPTVAFSDETHLTVFTNSASSNSTAISPEKSAKKSVEFRVTTTARTAGHSAFARTNNGDASITFDAEL